MKSFVSLALAFLALVVLAPQLSAAEPARPNILFLLIDDMGYADLSCYGNKAVHTDNIDRLAREGLRFTQYYVASPICSPSRTAAMTGQFPARWRLTSYLADRQLNARRGMVQWLDPQAPSLGRELQQAGYATGHFGKWHLGGQRDVGEAPLITDYGYDASLTQFEGLGDRILPMLDAFDGKPATKYALGSDKLGRGNITWFDRSRVTGAFVGRALEFIKTAEQSGKPFYVNLWPDDVHSPFFPPKALRSDGSKRALYHAVVQAMDDQLGEIFDYVRSSPKLRDNTIIIVASDNGPEPGAGSAGVFRGHKGTLFEGGVREPLIVWAPGLMAAPAKGTTNEKSVVAAVDLLPSLLRLAGAKTDTASAAINQSDGQDLSATLLGREAAVRTKPLFWSRPPDRPGPPRERFPDFAMREGDWKLLIRADDSAPQLYDLSKDAPEANNLAAKEPARVERMAKALRAWRATLPEVTLLNDNGNASAKESP
jgi:arylsulfatase A-like enzyme